MLLIIDLLAIEGLDHLISVNFLDLAGVLSSSGAATISGVIPIEHL